MLTVLGLNADAPAWRAARPGRELTALVDGLVAGLLEQRRLARDRRDFAAADAIRDTLTGLGVEVSDTPAGTRWSLLAGSSR
jgi:cysteinyl-tRNA synthetase